MFVAKPPEGNLALNSFSLLVVWAAFFMKVNSYTESEFLCFSSQNYVKAMRLFVGEPVWIAYNRPADHFPARAEYQQFLSQMVQ